MKKILSILIIIGCSHFSSFAQGGKLAKANKLYERLAYAAAIDFYEGAIDSPYDSPEVQAKLASCYYFMGESGKSELFFSKIDSLEGLDSEYIFRYAQVLKQNEKYTQSDQWMNKFYEVSGADSRAKHFVSNTNYLDQIKSQDAYFGIKHLSLNTAYAEFGGYEFGNSIYFVTNRRKRVSVQSKHAWNNKQFLDLYISQKSAESELEEVQFFNSKINKKFHEGPVCFSPDGKTVFYTRNNMLLGSKRRDDQGIQNLKIYIADVDDSLNWVNEREFYLNSKDYSIGHPTISKDGKYLYFVSDMPGGYGGADIYRVEILGKDSFGSPENLGSGINTEGQEMFPWIDGEGRLFLSSNGWIGLGGLDVFVAFLDEENKVQKMVNLGEPINSPMDDFAFIMLADNTSGYFSSNRHSGSGSDDIYSFTLIKALTSGINLKGVITDLRSGEILSNALVRLRDKEGNHIGEVRTNDKGEYQFSLEFNKDYKIEVEKEYYFPNSKISSTVDLDHSIEVLNLDISLEKDPGLSLFALVTSAKTGLPLKDVKIVLTDNITGKSTEFTTSEDGILLKPLADNKLNDRGSYQIQIECEGYFPKTVTYNTIFNRPGQYDVHKDLDLSLDVAVEDLSELVQINPINFDLNKYNIRPDAALELDKIVEVMNKYPNMVVELGAHTDCRGSKAYNEKLSDNRAKASAKYISDRITKPERIYGKGYGESKLLNDCACEGNIKSSCSEEEHSENRRTEFRVISNDGVNVINTSTDSFDN